MVTAVVAACAVLAAGVLAVLAVHRSRRESERQLEIVFERVSSHLDALSTSVEQAVARMVDAQRERSQPLSLDFDALVDALVAEAAARTGADAVVLRVEGPGGRPVLASLGAGTESELAERAFAPPDARPFRAATIDWTYSASGEADDEGFRSALVAPIGGEHGDSGNAGCLLVDVTRVSNGARVGAARAGCRVRHGPSERAALRGRRSPAPSRSHDGCCQPPWLRGGARPGSRSRAPDRAPAVGRAGWDQRHRDCDDRRQRERRRGRPTSHASHAKERHIVQTWRPRVCDPDAGDEGVGRTRSDHTPSGRGEARTWPEPDDDRGGARRMAARRASSRRWRRASTQP